MDNLYIRDAATGRPLRDQPLQFVRAPIKGDFVASTRGLLVVVRVVHDWDQRGLPIAIIDIAPAVAPNPAGTGSNHLSL